MPNHLDVSNRVLNPKGKPNMKNITLKVLVVAALGGALLCGNANVARADEKLPDAEMKSVVGQKKLTGQKCVQAGTGSCVTALSVRNGKCVSDYPDTWKHCVADSNAPKGVLIECGEQVMSCSHFAWIPVNKYNQKLTPTVGVPSGGTCRDAPGQTSLQVWRDYQTGCDLG